VVLALNGCEQGNRKKFLGGWRMTILCGFFFIGMQVYEFTHFCTKG
jgi:heme/copper-type cytochrome/quinol oxidase subunit 3